MAAFSLVSLRIIDIDNAALLCACVGLIFNAGGLFYLPYPIASSFRFLWLCFACIVYLPALSLPLLLEIDTLLLFCPACMSNSGCEFATVSGQFDLRPALRHNCVRFDFCA